MPIAEIIAIGTELLLGDKQDTNTQFIARGLRDLGIDLYRTMMIGDNVERIAHSIQESLQRADIVITTGGLGPTIDDPTRQAIAAALGRGLVFHEALWQQIQERFVRWGRVPTENNRRQAFLPEGAIAIINPVGTAPAFQVPVGENTIISLPGVPKEMEELFTTQVKAILQQRYHLDQILVTHTLHVAGMGESEVDELISDLEELTNPTVGLLAHAGQIDIRVAAKGATREDASQQITPVTMKIRSRLGENIFGEQEETLEKIVGSLLSQIDHHMIILESGLDGMLTKRLSSLPALKSIRLPDRYTSDELNDAVEVQLEQNKNCVVLGASVSEAKAALTIHMVVAYKGGKHYKSRSYGGPSASVNFYASTMALDFLRRILLETQLSK